MLGAFELINIEGLFVEALKNLYKNYLDVPIDELLERIELEEEEKVVKTLNDKITNILSEWLFEVYKSNKNLTHKDLKNVINSIETFIPEEIGEHGKYFKEAVIVLQLYFKKEDFQIGTYLIGYLMNEEGKMLKNEIKLFNKRDDVPNFVRDKLLNENTFTLDLYNNKSNFSGGKK